MHQVSRVTTLSRQSEHACGARAASPRASRQPGGLDRVRTSAPLLSRPLLDMRRALTVGGSALLRTVAPEAPGFGRLPAAAAATTAQAGAAPGAALQRGFTSQASLEVIRLPALLTLLPRTSCP